MALKSLKNLPGLRPGPARPPARYGVCPRGAPPPVRMYGTMKMDTASRLADEIENLHEVEEALRGTSYLKELYDLQFFGYADR